MEIRKVGSSEKELIDKIVTIHMDSFKGFFLTFMGRGFLNQMYRAYCDEVQSGLLVAQTEDGAVGFLAYSGNMSGLYKLMLKKRFVPFAWYSLGAVIRKPKAFAKLLGALLKPEESKREEEYMRLASVCVAPNAGQKGVGSQLIGRLKELTDFNKYAYITLETDAEDNDAVNKFYLKNGFYLFREYEEEKGRKMNEYKFVGEVGKK